MNTFNMFYALFPHLIIFSTFNLFALTIVKDTITFRILQMRKQRYREVE